MSAEYVESTLASLCNLLPGTFAVIVDTGCSVSSSYDKADFEYIYELKQPVRLQGVNGDCQVTHGGVMKFQCINDQGQVFDIKTMGYYNPAQKVCLFSPQSYFKHRPNQSGEFTISWAWYFLKLTDQEGTLPCHIDRSSLMPLLYCFHDADAAAKALSSSILANPCVSDDQNTTLTPLQRLLL